MTQEMSILETQSQTYNQIWTEYLTDFLAIYHPTPSPTTSLQTHPLQIRSIFLVELYDILIKLVNKSLYLFCSRDIYFVIFRRKCIKKLNNDRILIENLDGEFDEDL